MVSLFRNQLGRLFRWNETRIHELNYLFWECTTRCNLHCRHCGSDCTAPGSCPDMPLDDFLRAFDTIPRSAIVPRFTVVLTGGEPLLRPDIEEVGRAIRQRGAGWSMVSNGWFYDEAMHRRLMAAGMGALTISLDGLEPEHDWMRGREGCYRRTLNAIAIAARERRLNFDVVTCVNQRTLPQLQQLHDLLARLGVRQWRIFTIIPIGRAKDDPELHLTNVQFVELMEFIKVKREKQESAMNVTFSCEGYLGRYECRCGRIPSSAMPASISPRYSSTVPSVPVPTSTAKSSDRATSIRTTSGRCGTTGSRLSATAHGHDAACAKTAASSATAWETVCTIGMATVWRSSTATTARPSHLDVGKPGGAMTVFAVLHRAVVAATAAALFPFEDTYQTPHGEEQRRDNSDYDYDGLHKLSS